MWYGDPWAVPIAPSSNERIAVRSAAFLATLGVTGLRGNGIVDS
jgi:hypothetical protein